MSSASSAVVVVSSGTDDDSLLPFSDDADVYEDIYEVDCILKESVRPVAEEHASVPGLRLGEPSLHYLVKWAGYPTSQSSWIPVPLCSKSLVLLWKQRVSRNAKAAADQSLPESTTASAVATAAAIAVRAAAAAAIADEPALVQKLADELHEMKMSPRHRCICLASCICFNLTQLCAGA